MPLIALEQDGAGSLLRRYTYGLRRISMSTGGDEFYYHYDPIGSVTNLTSSSGASERSYQYKPFGSTRGSSQDDSNAPTNPMQYTAEYAVPTGLYHLRARQYDPTLGRFVGLDPENTRIGASAIASYVYVANRPGVFVDPTGRYLQPSSGGRDAAASAASPAEGSDQEIDLPDSKTYSMIPASASNPTGLDPRFPTLASMGFDRVKFLFGEMRAGQLKGVHFEGPATGYLRRLQAER